MMTTEEDGGLIYGLEFQCRALCAVAAEVEAVQFMVGTQGLKMDNQVHLLEMDEDARTLSKTVFSHPAGEVWDLEPSPTDQSLVISRHSSLESGGSICRQEATLWSTKCGQDDDHEGGGGGGGGGGHEGGELNPVCSLGISTEGERSLEVNCVRFMPGQGERAMALAGNKLLLHDLSAGSAGATSKVISTGCLEGKGHTDLTAGAWNPHQNCQTFAAVNEHHVRAWDVRAMKQSWHLEHPGGHGVVRCLDFNPNKQYHLATAGDDGATRFWDIRAASKPLVQQSNHSHWVWSVHFNQFHDQLVLSSSSDSHVVLSCLASISSEPHGQLVDEEEEETDTKAKKPILEDGVIKNFEDHEESVYASAWSAADPWTFASLSYDGRLVVNQVPRAVKFKILNLA